MREIRSNLNKNVLMQNKNLLMTLQSLLKDSFFQEKKKQDHIAYYPIANSINRYSQEKMSIVLLKNSLTKRVQSMSQSYNKQLSIVVAIRNTTNKPPPVTIC